MNATNANNNADTTPMEPPDAFGSAGAAVGVGVVVVAATLLTVTVTVSVVVNSPSDTLNSNTNVVVADTCGAVKLAVAVSALVSVTVVPDDCDQE